jgi:hypothetical protein
MLLCWCGDGEKVSYLRYHRPKKRKDSQLQDLTRIGESGTGRQRRREFAKPSRSSTQAKAAIQPKPLKTVDMMDLHM